MLLPLLPLLQPVPRPRLCEWRLLPLGVHAAMSACQRCRMHCLEEELSLQWQHVLEVVPTRAAALGVAAAHSGQCCAVSWMQGARRPGQQLTVNFGLLLRLSFLQPLQAAPPA